ncbi:MAG TPA: hypothetical protein DHW61_04235, partial [Lachnoclostridium phytofermentans]|nr:hypothetical protein [Lachnoclostridium phytofermentans]
MRKLISSFLNLKIRWKLFACYLFAAIIPLFFVSTIIFNGSQRLLKEQSYHNIKNNLSQINSNITENLKNYYNIMDIIIVNKYIQDYIAIDYTNIGYEDMYYFTNNFFTSILLTNPYIKSITQYSENKTLPQDEYYFKIIDESISNQQWYQKVLQSGGKPIYGQYEIDKSGNGYFTIARSMTWHKPEAPTALLVVKIDVKQIHANIEKIGSDSNYFVIDPNGMIIFSTNDKRNGIQIDTIMQVSNLEDFEQQTITMDNQDVIITSLALDNGWKTIAVEPQSKFLNEAKQFTTLILIIFGIFALVAIISIYIISYAISKKTQQLTWAVKEVRNGNFRISLTKTSNDEIGELVEAFNDMSYTIDNLISEVYEKELSLKQSELNLLQEQVRPHFLYNSLSSISALAQINKDEETYKMVHYLSEFYRITLNSGKTKLKISDEIALTTYYVKIQKVRFKDKIDVIFSIDDEILNYSTLKLILQPVIENSINHGIYEKDRKLEVNVTSKEKEDCIIFYVQDNGKGFEKDT